MARHSPGRTRRYSDAFALILAVTVCAGPIFAQEPAQEIEAIVKRWEDAFRNKDIATIQSLYADDALLLPPESPAVEGSDAIAEVWREWSTLENFDLRFSPVRIEAATSADMAWEYGTYRLAFDSEEGRIVDNGKYIVVWKKIGDNWRVAADIFNSNDSR